MLVSADSHYVEHLVPTHMGRHPAGTRQHQVTCAGEVLGMSDPPRRGRRCSVRCCLLPPAVVSPSRRPPGGIYGTPSTMRASASPFNLLPAPSLPRACGVHPLAVATRSQRLAPAVAAWWWLAPARPRAHAAAAAALCHRL